MKTKRNKGRRVADETVTVKDVKTERNAVITNILMAVLVLGGGFMGDGVLDYLSAINQNMINALKSIATVEAVTKNNSDSIDDLEASSRTITREIYDLKLGQNSILNQIKSHNTQHPANIAISSNE